MVHVSPKLAPKQDARIDARAPSLPDTSSDQVPMSTDPDDRTSLLQEFRAAFKRMYREGDSADFEKLQRDPRMVKAQGLDLSELSAPPLNRNRE